MNRTLKAITAALLTLGLAAVGLPISSGHAVSVGSIGCCRQ